MSIKIITDSTTDIPRSIKEQYDIGVLPLKILLNGKEYLDGVTINTYQVYDAMRNGQVPKTSQVGIDSIKDCFRKNLEQGNDVIYIAFGSKMSGTCHTASMIADCYKKKFKDRKIEVIDSKGGSVATGLTVYQAALLNEAGKTFEEIVDVVKDLSNHVEHIFTLTNLDWMYKGGRLKKREAIMGNILKIRPVLNTIDGEMLVFKKVRGTKKALNFIVEEVKRRITEFPDQIIGISHADDPEIAKKLKMMIEQELGAKKFMINIIGATLGVHLGIGGVGIYFYNKKPKYYINEIDE